VLGGPGGQDPGEERCGESSPGAGPKDREDGERAVDVGLAEMQRLDEVVEEAGTGTGVAGMVGSSFVVRSGSPPPRRT